MIQRDPVDQALVDFILKTIKTRSTNDLLDYHQQMNMTLGEMVDKGLSAEQLNELPTHFIIDSVANNEISIEGLTDAGLDESTLALIGHTTPASPPPGFPPPPLRGTDNDNPKGAPTIPGGLTREAILTDISSGEALIKDIQMGLNRKVITRADLYQQGCSDDLIDRLISFENDKEVKYPKLSELEPLRNNATDIFFLGRRGSGKSTMLASFFSYSKRIGVLENTQDSTFGNKYRNQLQLGMTEGHLPMSTPKEFINHIPVNLKFEGNAHHQPLNFLDMAGELIDNVYDEGISGLQSYKDFIENQNDKILIFVLNYFENNKKIAEQEQHLDELFSIIKKFNITRKTIAVYLVLTKADLFPEANKQKFCDNYINKHYVGLLNTIKNEQKSGHKYKIKSFPFSIGPTKFSYILEDCNPETNTNLITYPKILMQQFEEDCPVNRRGFFGH